MMKGALLLIALAIGSTHAYYGFFPYIPRYPVYRGGGGASSAASSASAGVGGASASASAAASGSGLGYPYNVGSASASASASAAGGFGGHGGYYPGGFRGGYPGRFPGGYGPQYGSGVASAAASASAFSRPNFYTPTTYFDDIDTSEPLSDRESCQAYIESVADEPVRATEMDATLREVFFRDESQVEKNVNDLGPIQFVCCHILFQHEFFNMQERPLDEYTYPTLPANVTCTRMVEELTAFTNKRPSTTTQEEKVVADEEREQVQNTVETTPTMEKVQQDEQESQPEEQRNNQVDNVVVGTNEAEIF